MASILLEGVEGAAADGIADEVADEVAGETADGIANGVDGVAGEGTDGIVDTLADDGFDSAGDTLTEADEDQITARLDVEMSEISDEVGDDGEDTVDSVLDKLKDAFKIAWKAVKLVNSLLPEIDFTNPYVLGMITASFCGVILDRIVKTLDATKNKAADATKDKAAVTALRNLTAFVQTKFKDFLNEIKTAKAAGKLTKTKQITGVGSLLISKLIQDEVKSTFPKFIQPVGKSMIALFIAIKNKKLSADAKNNAIISAQKCALTNGQDLLKTMQGWDAKSEFAYVKTQAGLDFQISTLQDLLTSVTSTSLS